MVFSRLQSLCGLALSLLLSLGNAEASPAGSTKLSDKLSLSVKSSSSADVEQLILRLSFPENAAPQVFPLSNPERLVIDLPGISIKRNHRYALPEHSVIKEIRAGVHPDRLRLVLDFAEVGVSSSSSYSTELGKTELKLTFPTDPGTTSEPVSFSASFAVGSSDAIKLAKPAISPVQIEPPRKSIKPEAEIAMKEEHEEYTPGAKPILLSATKIEDLPAPIERSSLQQELLPKAVLSSASNVLSAIRFDPASSAVRFELQNLAPYTLTKRDAETYFLTLEDISPKHEGLTLPFFPPGEIVGLDSVVAKQVKQSLEISLNVEDGVGVTAFSSQADGINAVIVRIGAK